LNSLKLFVFVLDLLASSLSFQISAIASHLNFLLACILWTFSIVALGIAVVSTFVSFLCAFLRTNIVRLLTSALMAIFNAEMTATLERLFARHSAAVGLLITWNCVERIVLAVAEFLREEHAWWAVLFSVTVVFHWMLASMLSFA
jgi:hypothetical protein